MRDTKDTCEHCPAWMKHVDQDGREILVQMRNPDGAPVTKDGVPQHEKGPDGRILMQGSCCLRVPVLMANGMTGFPTTKSAWFCEDPDRHAMLGRGK
jgi:hypothetical protein